MSDRKAVIKNADMGEEMQQDAVDCATQALEKYNIEKVTIEAGNSQPRHKSLRLARLLALLFRELFDPTRKEQKSVENQYAIAFMHARQS